MKYENVKLKAIEEYPDLERLPSTKAIVYAYRYRKELEKCYTNDFGSLYADARFVENYGKEVRLGKNLSSLPPPLDLPNLKPYQHDRCVKCSDEKNDCIPVCYDCFKEFKALVLFYQSFIEDLIEDKQSKLEIYETSR